MICRGGQQPSNNGFRKEQRELATAADRVAAAGVLGCNASTSATILRDQGAKQACRPAIQPAVPRKT